MEHGTKFWVDHFKENAGRKRINWNIHPEITENEKSEILNSLKAWQLGETSDGKHLKAAARKYARNQNDPYYLESIDLFIKEEQKHGENLGKYVDRIGEERKKKDWGDTLFRKVRYFNTSMELWTITVIIVESAAQIFYQALHDATKCPLLKSICMDILIDEAHHIKYQNERLKNIINKKGIYGKSIAVGWYGLLFFGTTHAIWYGHKRAFKAGGIDKSKFFRTMNYKFLSSMRYLFQSRKENIQLTVA